MKHTECCCESRFVCHACQESETYRELGELAAHVLTDEEADDFFESLH